MKAFLGFGDLGMQLKGFLLENSDRVDADYFDDFLKDENIVMDSDKVLFPKNNDGRKEVWRKRLFDPEPVSDCCHHARSMAG